MSYLYIVIVESPTLRHFTLQVAQLKNVQSPYPRVAACGYLLLALLKMVSCSFLRVAARGPKKIPLQVILSFDSSHI